SVRDSSFEPPDADPHVRWCGRGRRETLSRPPYPDPLSLSAVRDRARSGAPAGPRAILRHFPSKHGLLVPLRVPSPRAVPPRRGPMNDQQLHMWGKALRESRAFLRRWADTFTRDACDDLAQE